jgi:hypothetical protein
MARLMAASSKPYGRASEQAADALHDGSTVTSYAAMDYVSPKSRPLPRRENRQGQTMDAILPLFNQKAILGTRKKMRIEHFSFDFISMTDTFIRTFIALVCLMLEMGTQVSGSRVVVCCFVFVV